MSTSREELHRLVDAVPVSLASLVKRLIVAVLEQAAQDEPLLRALADAPIDDEPVTPEEEAALAEARDQVQRGEVVTWDDLKRQLQAGDQ